MSYLVRAGSLTIVARSPDEATRIRDQLLGDDGADVIVTDMNGGHVDIDGLVDGTNEACRR